VRGIALAWLAGMGLLTWRELRDTRHAVPPGRYLAASGLYALLALLAEYQPAARVAALTAWGFDLAVLLRPGMIPGTAGPAQRQTPPGDVRPPIGTVKAA